MVERKVFYHQEVSRCMLYTGWRTYGIRWEVDSCGSRL